MAVIYTNIQPDMVADNTIELFTNQLMILSRQEIILSTNSQRPHDVPLIIIV